MEDAMPTTINLPTAAEVVGFIAVGLITVILNGAVLMAIKIIVRKNTTKSKFLYIFLGYLAVSDLLLGAVTAGVKLFCSIKGCGYSDCSFITGLTCWMISCSMHGIIFVAVDRLIFILYGIYYHRWFTTKRVYTAIVLSIIFAFMAFGPGLIPFYDKLSQSGFCSLVLLSPIQLQIYLVSAFWFAILVALIINFIVFCYIVRHINHIRSMIYLEMTGKGSDHLSMVSYRLAPSKKKAIKFLFYTTGAFIVTYGPPVTLVTVQLIFSIDLGKEFAITTALVNLNSILNPLVYAFWQKDIRDILKKSFRFGMCLKASSPVQGVSWRSLGHHVY